MDSLLIGIVVALAVASLLIEQYPLCLVENLFREGQEKAPSRAWRRSSFETPRWARKALMRTVESRTALGMVVAILFDDLRYFFLLFLGTLVGIGGEVF